MPDSQNSTEMNESADSEEKHPLRSAAVEQLLDTLRLLDDNDELFNFLLDVTTPREMTEMAQRLQVADLLSGGMAYANIEKETGASAATIARVSKCLQFGQTGYANALKKLTESN